MTTQKKYDAIIVGAGLAGIACALRLNKKGLRVLVLEKNDKPGGKLSELHSQGFRWDQGPSLLTEPENINELFELYGKNPSDYFKFVKHSESCRYFFNDNSRITLSSNLQNTKEEITEAISADEAENYESYISNSKKNYESLGALFLNDSIPSLLKFFHPKFIKNYPFLLSRTMFRSLNSHNASKFESDKMQLIFNRFGTYNGSNPYQMSGLYSMIPNLELNDGTYFPKNGMRSIIDGLYKLALEENIEFSFEVEVEVERELSEYTYRIDDNISGSSKLVICAIDPISFYDYVLKDAPLSIKHKKEERSTSGLVFYWGIDTKIPELGLHNILFSKDYEGEFNTIFKEQKNSLEPTIYIHISSLLNPNDATENGQNLFVMINTSSIDTTDDVYMEKMKQYIIDKIREQFKIDIRNHIVTENYWDKASIESLTGSYQGALYGAASNKFDSALKRHPNMIKKYDNLYFCGGAVHPGGGIPLVLRSAKIVANLIT